MYLYLKLDSYINKVFQESNVKLFNSDTKQSPHVIYSYFHAKNVERAKTFLASKEETILDLSAISFGRTLKSTLKHQQDI